MVSLFSEEEVKQMLEIEIDNRIKQRDEEFCERMKGKTVITNQQKGNTMSNTLLTTKIKARLDRRLEWANTDGNNMRANSNFPQYAEDVTILKAEISRLEAEIENIDREDGFLTQK